MATIEPIALCRFYYLGFDGEYEYAMRNIGHAAAYFGVDVAEIKAILTEQGLMPETVKRVHYNLASAHADAYALDLDGASLAEREAFVERVWTEFQAARAEGLSDTMIDHLDIATLPAEAEKLGITIEE